MKIKSLVSVTILLPFLAVPAARAAILNPVVEGNELTATISLPLAVPGGLEAELTVGFEEVVGLTLANLGLDAEAINPLNALLLARLPGSLTSIPAAFPALITIEPPVTGGLSFEGMVSIGLYTHNLIYTAGSPLRLFAAPLGGGFEDITESMGSGSYRVGGAKGDFSEFLIVADLRPLATVSDLKFDRLEALLLAHQSWIESATYAKLDEILTEARTAYDSGNLVAAIRKIEKFISKVEKADGNDIPNVWRSARDLTNVGGKLRAAAATLRFSLTLESNSGS